MITRSRRPCRPRRPPGPSDEDADGWTTGADDLCERLRAYLQHRSRGVDPPAALAEVWDLFYQSSIPRMRAHLRRLGLSEADREDCIQEVWSKLFTRPDLLPRGLRATELTAWVLTVARNRAIDVMRRQHLAPAGLDDLVDDGPGPSEVLDRRGAVAPPAHPGRARRARAGVQLSGLPPPHHRGPTGRRGRQGPRPDPRAGPLPTPSHGTEVPRAARQAAIW